MSFKEMVTALSKIRQNSVLEWTRCCCQVLPVQNVVNLGTGTGIIPILMEAKTEGEHFTGLEIQSESADMAARSVACNGLQEKINIVTGDIKEASQIFGAASFEVVTTNPPYMTDTHGLKNPDLPKAIARHEVMCTLDDVVREGARVLKPGGRFYICLLYTSGAADEL